MVFFSDLDARVTTLRALIGEAPAAAELPIALDALGDEQIVAVIAESTRLVRSAEQLRITAAGIAARRSTREHGHSGLAQSRGHHSPVSLVQQLTGGARADAAKHVRLGESLLAEAAATAAGTGVGEAGGDGPGACAQDDASGSTPWHAPLARALMAGGIGSAQHDAILRGLGDPPGAEIEAVRRATIDAWSAAAEQLIHEAADRTVEELARAARTVRDRLDPEGAARRFDEWFAARSFRLWVDQDGLSRASISFDDHMAAWVRTVIETALRPRRGGPRFVDAEEAARAQDLVDDPRTNDQLAYDLVMDTFRAGALADADAVFGTRQAGVRVVISASAVADAASGWAAIGAVEDDQTALPAWLIAQQRCETGTVEIAVDGRGIPFA